MSNQERTDFFTQCPFCSSREYQILFAFGEAVSRCQCDRCGGEYQREL
jgi:hypothetical protein